MSERQRPKSIRGYIVYWWMGKDVGATSSRKRRRSGQSVVLSCEDDSSDLGLSNFSDIGLQILAEGCPRLEKLCLIWCSAVTSVGLVILAQACRGLKVLDMQVHDVVLSGLSVLVKWHAAMIIQGFSVRSYKYVIVIILRVPSYTKMKKSRPSWQ